MSRGSSSRAAEAPGCPVCASAETHARTPAPERVNRWQCGRCGHTWAGSQEGDR